MVYVGYTLSVTTRSSIGSGLAKTNIELQGHDGTWFPWSLGQDTWSALGAGGCVAGRSTLDFEVQCPRDLGIPLQIRIAQETSGLLGSLWPATIRQVVVQNKESKGKWLFSCEAPKLLCGAPVYPLTRQLAHPRPPPPTQPTDGPLPRRLSIDKEQLDDLGVGLPTDSGATDAGHLLPPPSPKGKVAEEAPAPARLELKWAKITALQGEVAALSATLSAAELAQLPTPALVAALP
eukprot:CAMPEP_0182867698 /NCGR_PEP_ID=MMETSP0034_2-20130328/8875_1 /TAXON_ID=156128 /ORGANISM="Nephroselmis pyriformis, Strain CCMP717" /LENGTH=234 /DNA_ID=CAMNT_0025000071 /DNA_START=214 /DNA_END=915 /DNA_ORIENTATION=+